LSIVKKIENSTNQNANFLVYPYNINSLKAPSGLQKRTDVTVAGMGELNEYLRRKSLNLEIR
jgi:hypothetical protein